MENRLKWRLPGSNDSFGHQHQTKKEPSNPATMLPLYILQT
jgi:hypothetical protein